MFFHIMIRLLILILLLTACDSIQIIPPEKEPLRRPTTINISSECSLSPSEGVIYFMITDTKELPSIACEQQAWGCAVSEGNKHYVYSITDPRIYIEEMLHVVGCDHP